MQKEVRDLQQGMRELQVEKQDLQIEKDELQDRLFQSAFQSFNDSASRAGDEDGGKAAKGKVGMTEPVNKVQDPLIAEVTAIYFCRVRPRCLIKPIYFKIG